MHECITRLDLKSPKQHHTVFGGEFIRVVHHQFSFYSVQNISFKFTNVSLNENAGEQTASLSSVLKHPAYWRSHCIWVGASMINHHAHIFQILV